MKVVLFCGGFGTRLREHSDAIPKPLVDIGSRPIIWHLMKYYAHFGHKEFVLCLGYKGDLIKQYFLNYSTYRHRNFVMRDGGKTLQPAESDIADWTIHFVDTGLHNNIGQRLVAVKDYVTDDENFLANYSDQLSNFPLPDIIDFHNKNDMIASILRARPAQSFHHVEADDSGVVTQIGPMGGAGLWVNGGYMVLNRKIFDYIEPGDELVEQPFQRLIKIGKLGSVRWDGFYSAMDTYKDKISFDRMEGQRERPWQLFPDES